MPEKKANEHNNEDHSARRTSLVTGSPGTDVLSSLGARESGGPVSPDGAGGQRDIQDDGSTDRHRAI